MFVLLFLAAFAQDTPPNRPSCLTGRLDGKTTEYDDFGGGKLVLDVRLTNECEKTVRAFRGRIQIRGATDNPVWTADLSSMRPVIEPGRTEVNRWYIPLGSSMEDLWLSAAPERTLRLGWKTQVVAFTDGTVYHLDNIQGEAINTDPSLKFRKAMEAMGTLTGSPPPKWE